MTGKSKSNNKPTHDQDNGTLKNIVKSILSESNIIEETLKQKKMVKEPLHDQSVDLESLHETLANDPTFLEIIALKVSELILNNEEFRQIACDSIKLEMNVDIDYLKNQTKELETKNSKLEIMIEEQQQYSRRNCLLIHGVPSQKNEDTDQIAIDIIQSHLDIPIEKHELDRSHRFSKPNSPIIVKFATHNKKNNVYKNKKKLKGKGIFITESLTSKRVEYIKKLADLRKSGKIKSCWSADGKLFYTLPSATQKKIELDLSNPGKIISEK